MGWYKWRRIWLGIDLGSSNTRICVDGRGVVLNEPSVVALSDGQVIAVGRDAFKTAGRLPRGFTIFSPIAAGLVTDRQIAQSMLSFFLAKAIGKMRFTEVTASVAIPSALNEMEEQMFLATLEGGGVDEVELLDKSLAAAWGAGVRVEEARGCLLLDVGGGRSEAAVLSCNDVVCRSVKRMGGEQFETDIVRYVKREYGVLIGTQAARQAKELVGMTRERKAASEIEVSGRDLMSGLPKSVRLDNHKIRQAVSCSVEELFELVKAVLVKTPPELVSDIMKRGVVLSGGGGRMPGLAERLAAEIGIGVSWSYDPLCDVINGINRMEEELPEANDLKLAAFL